MQPVAVFEKHLVFKPNKKQEEKILAKGGSQEVRVLKRNAANKDEGDIHYKSLVGRPGHAIDSRSDQKQELDGGVDSGHGEDMQVDGKGSTEGLQVNGQSSHEEDSGVAWTLHFKALPEPSQPVTSRAIEERPITAGDPLKVMEDMSHSFVTSFYLSGHRFTHYNINIVVYRIYVDTAATNHNDLVTIVDGTSEKKRLLDPSGAFMLETSLRLEETASSDSQKKLKDRGVKELQALKETLRGVVDLEAGDRLAMDSRVK